MAEPVESLESQARELDAYVAEVARRVRDALGQRLVGVWLVGSAALEDYDPRRSDVDVQAVATERLPVCELRDLAARLEHETLPTPARGLEFVLYAADDLAAPGGPRYQLNLNTGPRMDHHLAYEADDDPGFWFAIDVSIARQGGRALVGPPPAAVFPELGRRLLATAVLEALDFYAGVPRAADGDRPDRDARDAALLSACRAWAWAVDGQWRSKGDSARWVIRRVPDPSAIDGALRRRDGQPTDARITQDDVDRTLACARAALAAITARSHG